MISRLHVIQLIIITTDLLLSSCSQPTLQITNTAIPPTTTLATTLTAASLPTSTFTPLPTIPTFTPLPTSTSKPTSTPTPVPELLTCQEPPQSAKAVQPVKMIYVKADTVWLWDEISRKKTQVSLPEAATAPLLSDDGQWIAFLKQGQAYDTPDKPVASIPLFLLNRQSGQIHQSASFETTETRQLYPQVPQVFLDIHWLPGGHFLLVQVYPQPLGDGILYPTGDLFLLNADTGSRQRLLKGGQYDLYDISPDGKQIAAIDTAATIAGRTLNDSRIQEGTLYLIDVFPEVQTRRVPLRLTQNPWTIFAPAYAPGGDHMAFQVEAGLAIVEARSGQVQEIPIVNPCAAAGCYWGGPLEVIWQPDGQSLYTLTSNSDYFDTRAETTLHLIRLEPSISRETAQVIHASPQTFSFSPDRHILSYWNQPDLDTPGADLNWVTLHLMDLRDGSAKRYTAGYVLRVISWSPESQRFLYTYSPTRMSAPVADRLVLGNICQLPQDLPVPEGMLIDHVRWLDPTHFLAWTTPASGIPARYTTGLYLYNLDGEGQPIHIDDQLIDSLEPYGGQNQLQVLHP